MRDDIHKEVTERLKRDFGFKPKGTYLREGKCRKCDKREVYAFAEAPWVIKCGRLDRCGEEIHVKELYPDIFDNWSKRHQQTPENPHAAADAYLSYQRGFDLMGLRSAYSQEWYRDQELGIGSATVRFPLPGGGYWERLIDQPSRFGKKKARFSYGGGHKGHCWIYPGTTLEQLARADELWFAEGIFDAIALVQKGKLQAVSTLTCNIYPEHFLADLRKVCGDLNIQGPRLIWAFDVGRAGVYYTRKFHDLATEQGWRSGAAQVRPDGEGEKLDWNDLAQRDRLKPEDLATYRWNGEVTIAASATAKALLIYEREKFASFPITFGGRQLWANFSIDRIQAELAAMLESNDPEFEDFKSLPFDQQWHKAAERAVEIEEVANCTFRTLYYQRDPNLEEGAYFLRVDFPSDRASVKATFSGSACAGSGDFMKRLASVAPGALWTGNQYQIVKLMQRQWANIRVVEAIQFTGYSIDHEAWIFGDLAVHKGRVYEPNDEDFFVLGKRSVKLRTSERMLKINYDPDKLDLSWTGPLVTAYGPKGLVVLAFWVLALFAEHIRAKQESLGFLEMTGAPGSGKTTLLEFLWKLLGRSAYEGFDPTKATNAGIARTLGQVGGLPVVLIEGDRGQDTPHAKRFEWDELKTAYNGRAVRTRAIANGGMETFEPPFRGAIVIAQNDTVEGSPAVRERIMGLHFDKGRFSPEGKAAGEKLKTTEIKDISGFAVHVVRREEQILARYFEAFAVHEAAMLKHPGCGDYRFAKNHAQLAAMLDAMRIVVTNLPDRDVADAHNLIRDMLVERHRITESDHPHVTLFWERFDHFAAIDAATMHPEHPIDHARGTAEIAISLVQFEARCSATGLRMPCTMQELKRLLKTSKSRRFIAVKTVNSVTGRSVACWVFASPDHQKSKGA
jgi:energy-coupling factor transporter ATP-binding protein EcfA2